MIDVMLDLETLATEQDAIVASIGAVKMDMDTNEVLLHENFHMTLHWVDQHRKGRACHPATVHFWLKQDKEAQDTIMWKPSIDNESVLMAFAAFMSGVDGLWGNGADFDCSILRSLFQTYEMRVPFKYWQHRCFRTMKNISSVPEPFREGVHHYALDDAIHQAKYLMEIKKQWAK
jgi:hypothetical protein